MSEKIKNIASSIFSQLTMASARKKVYSQKALKEDQQTLGHLLRVISHSESIQARRILNSIRGKIDTTEHYVSSIFESEINEIIKSYSEALIEAKEQKNKAFTQVLTQLKAAEMRFQAFYSKETKDIKNKENQKYFVCQFCGYIQTENIPEQCPICGAKQKGFKEIL